MPADANRDADTCPECGAKYCPRNPYGTFECDACHNKWRAAEYSALTCGLCKGATGRRVGLDRAWVLCPACEGTGHPVDAAPVSGIGGQCLGNRHGPHSKIRKNGPGGTKWLCKLCRVRW